MKPMKNLLYAAQLTLLVFLSAPLESAGYASITSMIRGGSNYLIPAAGAKRAQQDFSLSISPDFQTVLQGNSASYTATVTPSQGFARHVHLDIDSLPPGVHAHVSPRVVKGSGSSTVTLTTGKHTPLGTYVVVISATSGEVLVHLVVVKLVVS